MYPYSNPQTYQGKQFQQAQMGPGFPIEGYEGYEGYEQQQDVPAFFPFFGSPFIYPFFGFPFFFGGGFHYGRRRFW